jgi:ABC-type amino acid transport substrate-binding protein
MDAVMNGRWIVLALVLLATSSIAATATPQAEPAAERASGGDGPSRLVVATMELPPFSMRDIDGDWIGITIELWEAIAQRLGLEYVYREHTLPKALQAIESGQADIGAAAFSVTADRAKRMDFTHTYFGSDLGIATSFDRRDLLDVLLERMFSLDAL